MPTELKMLAWSILLGLVYVLVAGALVTAKRGIKWNAGNRDTPAEPLTGPPARAQRASANFMETFPFFAAAVLAVIALERQSPQTALAAQLYFWARLAYLPVYVIGIPYLRTLVWLVSLWGILQLVWALL
ncbi:MAPEG family protein [Pseudoxanthomonas spadix]|jgi:uncharacterized MAPEG superfamily protein|nr:MAPEG family protein [Pseudoxanthomonas spadix]MBP3975017.1 MAPEG family protein [Pseudoxanthomonas spadix]RMW92824.1 hypothetical protein D9R12_13665 [Pseudoxanthomonas spadix]